MKRIVLFFATLWLGVMGASAQGYRYDVNNDGSVNISDAIAVVNKILGKDNPGDVGGGGEAVDLGLPSGTLWASCNIGASKPEDAGGYYAWGETAEKDTYLSATYQYYQNGSYVAIGTDISGTEYDVATALWGSDWCMPTEEQMQELIDGCNSEWTSLNGVNGRKFTSKKNGNSIFLPAAGNKVSSVLANVGNYGYYHTATLSSSNQSWNRNLQISSSTAKMDNTSRYGGKPVRAVRASHKPKAIDLGLPSGTKWASCNVGASKPEEYGEYFAWGELGEKQEYTTLENYQFYVNGSHMDLGADISGTKYDVARQRWGGNWRMPTKDEIQELKENCTYEWTTYQGVQGGKFTSKKNGNSVFLPAAGIGWNSELLGAGGCGGYWTSTLDPSDWSGAYGLYFDSDTAYWSDYGRRDGRSVRPVIGN
ncbi:MAG: hypothetical protein IKX24_11530 [Prevotella sp.]|nr:hypothetical protein [Prevotella sp.]